MENLNNENNLGDDTEICKNHIDKSQENFADSDWDSSTGDYNSDNDYDDAADAYNFSTNSKHNCDEEDSIKNINSQSKDDIKCNLVKNNSIRRLPKTREQDAIAVLLSSYNFGNKAVDDIVDNFTEQGIGLKDLSALTKKDLYLLGIKNNSDQDDLLETFRQLPNQDVDYEKLCTSEIANDYNNRILTSATKHLNKIKTSTLATNLKLHVIKTDDALIDDNDDEFASTYVLKTIDEIRKIVLEMDERIATLEEFVDDKENTKEKGFLNKALLITGIFALSVAFIYWKRNL